MKLTNVHGLPAALVRAIQNDQYDHKPGTISATSLIKPPRIRQLEIRHDAEIEEDVTQRLWMLMGSAVHAVLERAEHKAAPELIEQRLYMDVRGWRVTGKPDLWSYPADLDDYKFTSVWASRNGVKPEWEAQLNTYALLYRLAGFPVERLRIVAIYRDWSKPEARRNKDYPQVGAETIPVKMWSDEEIQAWMLRRVFLHQDAVRLPDNLLPVCAPEERWDRPTIWAVMKNTNKRATRVFESEEIAHKEMEAQQKKSPKDKFCVVERPGESVRCQTYCPVNRWCDYYASMTKTEESEAA